MKKPRFNLHPSLEDAKCFQEASDSPRHRHLVLSSEPKVKLVFLKTHIYKVATRVAVPAAANLPRGFAPEDEGTHGY